MSLRVFEMEPHTELEPVFVLISWKEFEMVFEMVLEFPLTGRGSQKVCVPEIR